MYLSSLLIDLGRNPDRPRPGRLWLRNLYRVHQRLCMGFPSESKKSDDKDFLRPFDMNDFNKHVYLPRTNGIGFLFRVDPKVGVGRATILVQSAVKPDWDYAFRNSNHLLAMTPDVMSYDPRFRTGQSLRFRILANPVRKICKHSLDPNGKPFDEKWHKKRIPVPPTDFEKWLQRRAEPEWSEKNDNRKGPSAPGFRLMKITEVKPGYVYVNKTLKRDGGRKLRSARYEGVLEVTDSKHFHNTLIRGIGPSKAFGFGLLSVAPM